MLLRIMTPPPMGENRGEGENKITLPFMLSHAKEGIGSYLWAARISAAIVSTFFSDRRISLQPYQSA